jgi:hypothetical protein
LRPERLLTVPRPAALLFGDTATEIPRQLHIRASADGDHLDGVFEAETMARVVAPHDHDLGVTAISEVTGTLRLRGTIRDERIEVVAPAMFEFLRSAS